MMSKKVYVAANIQAKPGNIENIKSLLSDLQRASIHEDCCEFYHVFQRADAPQFLSTMECWKTPKAEQSHWETSHLKHAVEQIAPLIDGEMNITKYEQA